MRAEDGPVAEGTDVDMDGAATNTTAAADSSAAAGNGLTPGMDDGPEYEMCSAAYAAGESDPSTDVTEAGEMKLPDRLL